MIRNAFILFMISGIPLFPAVSFVTQPALSVDGGNRLWVEFQVNESTDVAVSIVDMRDSSVVRHLAAGVLGSKAPAPLLPNTLVQRIEWDGKDDLGFAVPAPAAMKARVRAGMTVSFVQYAGNNPYSFTKGLSALGGGIFGIVKGTDGTVFVCGNPGAVHHGHVYTPVKYVRQYDKDGQYLKTVYPYPSTLDFSRVQGWRAKRYPDSGSYTPIHSNNALPTWSNSLFDVLKQGHNPRLHFMDSRGRLVYGGERALLTFEADGGKLDTVSAASLISTPPIPGVYNPILLGGAILTPMPLSDDILVSGIYAANTNSGHLVNALDTGVYRDGRVFRVDPATRTASVWLDLDTVITVKAARFLALQGDENMAAIHGMATDDKNRIYVCDRFNERIGVYDTAANLLGSITLPAGEKVAINGTTREIYALARQYNTLNGTGALRLYKFAPFDSGAALRCSLNLSTGFRPEAFLVVNDSSRPATVWVGDGTVKIYRDLGTSFALSKDFNVPASSETPGFDRLTVDRRNETVYFNDTWWGLYKITDWSNPVIRVCSTSANKRLLAKDCAISPHDILYVRQSPGTESNDAASLGRYTLDDKHVPVNWTNTGGNIMAPHYYNKYGVCTAERGLAVRPDGVVASMHTFGDKPQYVNKGYEVAFYSDSGSRDTLFGKTKVWPLPPRNGGIKFDIKGNLYIGAKVAALGQETPAVFTGDYAYSTSAGSIIRFPAGFDTASVTSTGVKASSYKTYTVDMAPYSSENGGGFCICRSPRFDVDPYGRLFVPNAVTCRVAVIDNEGNDIIRFGKYGNIDGPAGGATVSLNWPTSVAASEDFIYVADFANNRIARMRMNYEADNLPDVSAAVPSGGGAKQAKAEISVAPNPFNPQGTVAVSLSVKSRVRVEVFSPAGRLVATLASDILPAGRHRFTWNGTDRAGSRAATGVYYIRLAAGQREYYASVVLVK